MAKICYVPKNFRPDSLRVIDQANRICAAYKAKGYDLTLRQLYYQFVSRGLIPNNDAEYKKLGSIINDARLAGLLDWDYITDRTRNLQSNGHWDSPETIIEACAQSFRLDKWDRQPNYVEVWVEKDALIGVIERACRPLDVAYISCRGYMSQSEIWQASQRLIEQAGYGKDTYIIHLGDHDPSGIDMSRDILDRLTLFMEHEGYNPVKVERIALNHDQVRMYNPPPNPAKLTDARATGYIQTHGYESWELDALDPDVIVNLIDMAVADLRDEDLWEEAVAEEKRARTLLKGASNRWSEVETLLEG